MKFERPEGWSKTGKIGDKAVEITHDVLAGLTAIDLHRLVVNVEGVGDIRPFRDSDPSEFDDTKELDDGDDEPATGPTLMLQSSRNVRGPLHEGLEFVDETVDAMSAANPVAMDDITGQILRVLADAKDYTDARKRLQDAFPTMDRSQLRNMLTGGMLIAQAAGMESVQREAK